MNSVPGTAGNCCRSQRSLALSMRPDEATKFHQIGAAWGNARPEKHGPRIAGWRATRFSGLAHRSVTARRVRPAPDRALGMIGRHLERACANRCTYKVAGGPRASAHRLAGNDGQFDARSGMRRQSRRRVARSRLPSSCPSGSATSSGCRAHTRPLPAPPAGFFGMRDPAAGRHPVHVPGRISRTVPRLSRCSKETREQIGHGGERDMRVRPYIDSKPGANWVGPR